MTTDREQIEKGKEFENFASRLQQTHHLRLGERLARGKEMREHTPRKSHSEWNPPGSRRDPINMLIENDKERMDFLIPIRYGRMAASPFNFFRGAAAIMASDLSHTPSTGINGVICGDCHLLNFGGFATTERRLIFDINDFDEVSIGPWEWDVKRLATSFIIAGRSIGLKAADNREAAFLAAQSYRLHMAEHANMDILRAWTNFFNLEEIIDNMKNKSNKKLYTQKLQKVTDEIVREKEFARLAFVSGDKPRIIEQPPLIFHFNDFRDNEIREQTAKGLLSYRSSLSPERCLLLSRYQLVDTAYKVVGIGSVGMACGIGLLMSGNGNSLFLQFKQTRQSVLEPYAGINPYQHTGQRVVVGQRVMQTASDMFLGWSTGSMTGNQYYIRQLRDAKIKPVIEIMDAVDLKNFAGMCGRVLARAHSRSLDAVVLTGYLGKGTPFEEAIADFSIAYADQNERDYGLLMGAIHSGKIKANMEQ